MEVVFSLKCVYIYSNLSNEPMFLSTLSALIRIFDLLTAPHSSIRARDQRRQARLLASILGFLLLFGVTEELVFNQLIRSKPVPFVWQNFVPLFSLLLVAYIMSRTRVYRLGAVVAILSFSIAVALLFVTQTKMPDPGILVFLIFPVLLSSFFGDVRATAIVGIINMAILVALVYSINGISFDNAQITFYLIFWIIVLFSMSYRNALERSRQAALVESEKRYRALSETVFDGLIEVEGGIITRLNLGFAQIFESAESSVEGRRLTDFIPDAARLLSSDSGAMARSMEMQGITAKGTSIDLEVVCKALMFSRKKVDTIAVRNITERKKTEELLRTAQRMDSLGVLTGGIAHDFNNMLTGILAQTSLAAHMLSEEHAAYPHIRKATKSAVSAAELTRQLLVYAGKTHTEAQQLDLNKVVRDTINIVDATLPSTVELKTHLFSSPLFVCGDYGQMQQVVLNLLINGIQAMQAEPGSLQISTVLETIAESHKGLLAWGQQPLPAGEYVRLSVQDSGIGMNDETKKHIFDPFYTTKEEGHGLGLSAILGIVRSHGGVIDVESQLGQGTTFTILLPRMVQEPEPNGIVQGAQKSVERTDSPLILVVDDEEPIRDAVTDLLEMAGLRILTAPNGREGVELFRKNQRSVDLAILDLKMPGMSGEETFEALRAIDPAVKVIVSSGYGDGDILERVKEKGIADFLQKPYDFDMLIAKIEAALS